LEQTKISSPLPLFPPPPPPPPPPPTNQAILATTEALVEGKAPPALAPTTVAAFRAVLQAGLDKQSTVDRSLLAYALSLPEELTLLGEMPVMRPVALHDAREHVRRALAQALGPELEAVYAALDVAVPYEATPQEIGRRRLKNVCLSYLSTAKDEAAAARALAAFRKANCMTDSLAALACLASLPGPAKDEALAAFYERAGGDPLVLNKWFTIQALADLPDAIDRVVALTQHKVRPCKRRVCVFVWVGVCVVGERGRWWRRVVVVMVEMGRSRHARSTNSDGRTPTSTHTPPQPKKGLLAEEPEPLPGAYRGLRQLQPLALPRGGRARIPARGRHGPRRRQDQPPGACAGRGGCRRTWVG
jgi:hypothetical protein